MPVVRVNLIGRLGNQMFQWAYAKALAEQRGLELVTNPWVGEQIFTLDGYKTEEPAEPADDTVVYGYCQAQQNMIYSRADCRRWFKVKPEFEDRLFQNHVYDLPHVHFRRGDYASAGYPIVSRRAVETAMLHFEIERPCIPVSDDKPRGDPDFSGELSMLPDFYRMMRAPILFRANSSFSWWAATLGRGRVFAPIITGFRGGIEHDSIPYVEGNWPRLADLDFVTDLHLRET